MGGGVNMEGASRSPIVSDLPRLLARYVIGPYRSNSRGTARVSDGGAASGSVAGEGWLTGLAGAVCSRWCSRSTVGVAIIFPLLSESWPPPAAPMCPMVLLSPPSALLPSSAVSV